MFEIVVLFLVMFSIATWFFFRSLQKPVVSVASTTQKLKVPEDSVLKRHFLTHLQSEIEAALFPRPTDSVLQRHYDSLVAAELENRLVNAE
jgi:hypothetical protein